MRWVLDLDGVMWLGDEPISGSAAAVAAMDRRGDQVLFVTNNSWATLADHEAKLQRHGVHATGRVLSSATGLTALLGPGDRVLVCGGPGIVEAVIAAGAEPIDAAGPQDPTGEVSAVAVGYHRHFDYEVMRRAAAAVRHGARLLATNADATYPTPGGPIPGAGAILAGIERAAGTTAVVAGKPHQPVADVVAARFGRGGATIDAPMVVGDRCDTDGRFAETLGYRFGLVLSGVTAPGDVTDPEPDVVSADLASLVAAVHGPGATAGG